MSASGGPFLQRIVIQGYRSLRSVDLNLGPINILVGSNGAGKSNFAGFFRFLRAFRTGNLDNYVVQHGGADRLLFFGRKVTEQLAFSAWFAGTQYGARFIPTADFRLVRRTEDGSASDREDRALFSAIPVKFPSQFPRTYHFHDTTPAAKLRQPARVDQNKELQSDGGNLPAFLRGMRETQAYRQIVQTVRRVAPYFLDFELEPFDDAGFFVGLNWRHVNDETLFTPNDLSDGTLRFIALATLLLQPEPPSMILIDEPELGLHPHAIALLAALMRSVSERTQLIVCTQSVTLVNQFDASEIVVVDRVNEATEMRRLDPAQLESWLDEYAVGDLWEKNLFGGTP